MIQVDLEKCIGCGQCERICPLRAIYVKEKKAVVKENCASCLSCLKVCKLGALSEAPSAEDAIVCTKCGVKCRIAPGQVGVCKRFTNVNGELERNRPLQIPEKHSIDKKTLAISRPLITAVGAGAAYPDYHPAPYIVEDEIDDFDVVTAVTEAPISYSSMVIKIDTNMNIGEEGAAVSRDGKVVGMVSTEQYGSHILVLGGVNRVKGPDGMTVVKTMVELANKEQVQLKVQDGSTLDLQVGAHPVVDGEEDSKMRVGCGGACCGLFAKHLGQLVDEAIILDHHITGLFTRHPAGAEQLPYSGIIPVGRFATPGRYFFDHGNGWGGTNIEIPREAIKEVDKEYARPGMKILVAETTWRKVALFELNEELEPVSIPLTSELEEFRKMAAANCEDSRVSAMYYAGVGGSARAGVTVNPIEPTKAVHRGDAHLTIAGAPTFVMPGGGITFLADIDKMVPKPFTYTASPAVVAPIEYTVLKSKYKAIGGHIQAIRPLNEVLKEGRFAWYQHQSFLW